MRDGFVRIAAAMPPVRVGDCAYNAGECLRLSEAAAASGVRLLLFPELCLTGATCGQLFHHDALLSGALAALRAYLEGTAELDLLAVVGLPLSVRDRVYDCAAVCCRGRLLGLVPKAFPSPAADADNARLFAPAPAGNLTLRPMDGAPVAFGTGQVFACASLPSLRVGVEIGEDALSAVPPSTALIPAGVSVVLNPCAPRAAVGLARAERGLARSRSALLRAAYARAGSGDGESTTDAAYAGHAVIAENGEILAERAPFSSLPLLATEIDLGLLSRDRRAGAPGAPAAGPIAEQPFRLPLDETVLTRRIRKNPFVPEDPAELAERCSMVLSIQAHALRRRMIAAGARRIVVGVSGGLDSAWALIVMTCAVDLLSRPRRDILAVSMPAFGTTERTERNARELCRALGVDFRRIDISDSVGIHFRDIGHDPAVRNTVYENAQARERTQVLMDLANEEGGFVVGTGDLSELALGWATYNGDHMSMYGVNSGVPKTLIRRLAAFAAERAGQAGDRLLCDTLTDILATPVSPELLPADGDGRPAQGTEDRIGPYELHDFFLYHFLRHGASPSRIFRLARAAFSDGTYDDATILKWLDVFLQRFFRQQFKRSCLPDGPAVGSVALSPRIGFRMPSDASAELWAAEVASLRERYAPADAPEP